MLLSFSPPRDAEDTEADAVDDAGDEDEGRNIEYVIVMGVPREEGLVAKVPLRPDVFEVADAVVVDVSTPVVEVVWVTADEVGGFAGSVVDAAFAVKVGEVVDVVGAVEVDVRAPGMSDHQNVGM